MQEVGENLGCTQILPKLCRKGAVPQKVDDGLLLVLADWACLLGGDAPVSKCFSHWDTAVKTEPYEMLNFWNCVNFPQPFARKDAGAFSTISRQIIS